jgi:hypothetical protein
MGVKLLLSSSRILNSHHDIQRALAPLAKVYSRIAAKTSSRKPDCRNINGFSQVEGSDTWGASDEQRNEQAAHPHH